jgi:hypothetical protein
MMTPSERGQAAKLRKVRIVAMREAFAAIEFAPKGTGNNSERITYRSEHVGVQPHWADALPSWDKLCVFPHKELEALSKTEAYRRRQRVYAEARAAERELRESQT